MTQAKKSGTARGRLAIIALALILAGSFCAQLFNTSFYSTKVSRISFSTPSGRLSGILYMPKGAGPDDPRPTIVTTHGYLNSAEMQDAGAIEMSRRGYIVLALDMYDHGHSQYLQKFGKTPSFFSFWPTSIYDAVQYIYAQPYSLKDAAGNGIIAVAGHSMGGFSANMSMVLDEGDFAKTGIRKIHAGISMGSDYEWSNYLKVTAEVSAAAFGPRVAGKVAGHYDEFFFDNEAEKTGATVIYKDYVKTADGQLFLGNPANPEQGRFYMLPNGGERVIYTPNEIHPWNHFSSVTTGNLVRFYAEAFKGYIKPTQTDAGLAPANQIWFFKELSEFAALIGFFLLFLPLVSWLISLPAFAGAKTELKPAVSGASSGSGKTISIIVTIFAALFPALAFPTFMDKPAGGMAVLQWASLALAIIALAAGFIRASQKPAEKKTAIRGGILTALSALLLFVLSLGQKVFFQTDAVFSSPTTNQIIFWALGVTSISVYIALADYYLRAAPAGNELERYGFGTGWKSVGLSFAVAVIAVAAAYALLFIVDAVFNTDFRFWVWAVKTFDARHVGVALRYAPFFFIYYYAISITLNSNTARIKGWKGDILACLINVGGLALFLILQYCSLFATGRGLFPTQALNSILLFALVPSLIVASLYSKQFYRISGNVYVGAFVNTLLMTMITIANTTVYSGF